MTHIRLRAALTFLAVAATLMCCGCTADYYRRSADRDVYAIIAQKTPQVPGMEPSFSLERAQSSPLAADVVASARAGGLAPLSLVDAIRIAAANSRDFQNRREDVFRQALSLSSERHALAITLSGVLSGLFDKNGERFIEGGSDFTVSKALSTGGDVALSLSTTFLRFLTGDPRREAQSVLAFSLTQPLWRGAGSSVALENLTQAERDMIYKLRSFVQYRRSFFVSVANAYYQVLRQKNVVDNERLNMENVAASRERANMLSEAGRLPGFQVDQAEQDELSARDRWVQAVRTYESLLDDFKITMGLPPDAPIELDHSELTTLMSAPIQEPKLTRDEAVERALRLRLDLATARDEVADAERKVFVAKDSLNPDLDLTVAGSLGTVPPTSFTRFSHEQDSYSAGLSLGLPLDRLDERNDYRSRLIDSDRSRRDQELLRDQVVQGIFEDWRRLEEARNRHRIQERSVQLAERRVESTGLLIEAGRAEMRDQLDAQEALVLARNTLAETRVSYLTTLLGLWRDMEVLVFRDGQFVEEIPDVSNPQEQ